MITLTGKKISEGVAIGKLAFYKRDIKEIKRIYVKDVEKEIQRLRKEEKRLAGELKRSEGMLGNPNFVNKAPAAKIEEEKAKLEKYQGMMAQVKERLSQLGADRSDLV